MVKDCSGFGQKEGGRRREKEGKKKQIRLPIWKRSSRERQGELPLRGAEKNLYISSATLRKD